MRAKKSFGQHFLHDGRVLHGIGAALEVRPDEVVCEIGPGTGRLTKRLLERVGPERLICLERDRDMIEHLGHKFPDLRVIEGDATRFDWSTVVTGPAVVCGNLPYNVSAPIYFHLLEQHRSRFRRMVLMFQKEVAQRFVAQPGSKRFGPPSAITHVLADARLIMTVKPGAFRPPPKVDSAVIRVDPLAQPRFDLRPDQIPAFSEFVHSLFRARRKTVLNNLKPLTSNPLAALEAAGIEPRLRAEMLSVESLVDLMRRVLGSAP